MYIAPLYSICNAGISSVPRDDSPAIDTWCEKAVLWIQEIQESDLSIPVAIMIAIVSSVAIYRLRQTATPEPGPFNFSELPGDLQLHVLSFMEKQKLRRLDYASHFSGGLVTQTVEMKYGEEKPAWIPAGLSGVALKQLWLYNLPKSITPEFYKAYLGDPEPIVPIPLNYIEAVDLPDPFGQPGEKIKDNFQLTFIPEFIRITVPRTSELTLNQNGRLIEDPNAAGQERQLQVPVTLNNIRMLFKKCLKQGAPTGLNQNSWRSLFHQHGDTRTQSHWFYPRKGSPIGIGKFYAEQEFITETAGLEVTPLLDTVLFCLLRQTSSETADTKFMARTSTPILDGNGFPTASKAAFRWTTYGQPSESWSLLSLWSDYSRQDDIGASVGVPAGTSQAIG